MHIKEIISQYRRDFKALMECEHCGDQTINNYGYDDANYHGNVIPAMICEKCGKHADDNYTSLPPKYPEGFLL